jgi:hypothetical protein
VSGYMCVNCRMDLSCVKETGESGIYGADDDCELCVRCFDGENDLIEERGGNDLPDVLAFYRKNLALGPL